MPVNATNKEVFWSTSDATIATISYTGILVGLKNVSVNVIAKAKDGSGILFEKANTISGIALLGTLVSNITITGSNITDGKPHQLLVQILPANATTKNLSWTISSQAIATINCGQK